MSITAKFIPREILRAFADGRVLDLRGAKAYQAGEDKIAEDGKRISIYDPGPEDGWASEIVRDDFELVEYKLSVRTVYMSYPVAGSDIQKWVCGTVWDNGH
jgi:hypothetical protein